MSFSIRFFDGDSVHVVVGAEWNDFLVWRNVVDNASSDTINVKVVGVHERHAAQEENSASDFAQRLVRW